MFLVTGCVIDEKLNLVGLAFDGKITEFGEQPPTKDGVVTRLIPISQCAKYLSNCRNFYIDKYNNLQSKQGVKLHDLNMYLNGVVIPNGMQLTNRIVKNDVVIGYEVLFENGEVKRFSTKDVIRLNSWFKGVNFNHRNRDGKEFLVGKNCKLDELPSIYMGEQKKKRQNKENIQKEVARDVKASGKVGQVDLDLIGLFDILDSNNCFIIDMSNNKYHRTTDRAEQVDTGFMSLGTGNIASAKLTHGKDKLNANIAFKKPGIVNVPEVGNVLTFTHTTKTIFRCHESYVSQLGVVVSDALVGKFLEYVGNAKADLKIEEITDKKTVASTGILTGLNGGFKIFKLNVDGLVLMSKDKIDAHIMTIDELMHSVVKSEMQTLVLKAFKTQLNKYKLLQQKEVCARFKVYNENVLSLIANNKIDIYQGHYTGTIKVDSTTEENKSKAKQDLEIAYSALPNKLMSLKGNSIWDGEADQLSYVAETIAKAKQLIEQGDIDGVLALQKAVEKSLEKTRGKLWKHKVAMVQLGHGEKVHTTHDVDWEKIVSRSKIPQNNYQTKVGNNTLKIKLLGGLDIN